MERESNPMPMCRSGCGFYGNPAQDGLCSVCFKDALRKKQQPPVSSTPVSASSPVNSSTQTINPSTAVIVPSLSNQSTPTHVDHNTALPTVLLHNNLSSSADKDIDCAKTSSMTVKSMKSEDENSKRKRTQEMSEDDEENSKKQRVSLTAQNPNSTSKKTTKRLSSSSNSSKRNSLSKKSLPDESADCAGPSSQDDDKDGDKDAKKKKNRCVTCRKKVGLTGFECRCGGLFCAIHRYSDKHECSFDYREHGAAEIRRNNPVVVGEKIQKI